MLVTTQIWNPAMVFPKHFITIDVEAVSFQVIMSHLGETICLVNDFVVHFHSVKGRCGGVVSAGADSVHSGFLPIFHRSESMAEL